MCSSAKFRQVFGRHGLISAFWALMLASRLRRSGQGKSTGRVGDLELTGIASQNRKRCELPT
jgi:hypothetical protein